MTTTNRYDAGNPNHTVTCARSACEGKPLHQAGRHLDQRSEHYDGPDTQLTATSMYVRSSARKIITDAPGLTPEVIDLVTYVDFLGNQVVAARVDRDQGVREASQRALNCPAHGEVIKGLESQVAVLDSSQRCTEAGRLALLGFLHAVDEFTREYRKGYSGLTVGQLVNGLEKASKKVHAAHDRAWKR